MVCTKKILFRTNGLFWARKWYILITQDRLRMKGTNSYMKILLVVFWEKKFIWGNLIFLAFRPFFTVWLGMVKLSQTTVNWILKQSGHDFFPDYYRILRLIRILKQWRHISQVNIYVMDIVWMLCDICVEVKSHGLVKLL